MGPPFPLVQPPQHAPDTSDHERRSTRTHHTRTRTRSVARHARAHARGRAIARSAPIATIDIHPRDFAQRSACELACGWNASLFAGFSHIAALPICARCCVHLSFRNVVSLGFGATGPSLQGADAAAASPIPAVPRQPQLGGPASCHPPPVRAPSASGLGAHPCHICAGTGLDPATSAPGLGSPLPFRFGNHPRSPHPRCSNVTRYSQGGGMVV